MRKPNVDPVWSLVAQASRVANILNIFQPAAFLTADPSGHRRIGVMTTSTNKEQMRFELARLLRTKTARFYENFFSSKCAADVKSEICAQLKRFRYEFKQARDAFGKTRAVLTGKSGSTRNDDLAMALMMLAFWAQYAIEKQRVALVRFSTNSEPAKP